MLVLALLLLRLACGWWFALGLWLVVPLDFASASGGFSINRHFERVYAQKVGERAEKTALQGAKKLHFL